MKRVATCVRASSGIAVGRACVIVRRRCAAADVQLRQGSAAEEEARFNEALAASDAQIETLSRGDEIFAAHLEMVRDAMVGDTVRRHIGSGLSALGAVRAAGDEIAAMFEAIDDEYLSARADDIRDIFARIEANLTGGMENPFERVAEGDIIVADELAPSDMALVDFSRVRGFVTRRGSATSHVCIIARSRSIPALVGLGDAVDTVAEGDMLAIDADSGEMFISPDAEVLARFSRRIEDAESQRRREAGAAQLHFTDGEGRAVGVFANAGSVEDVRAAIDSGADGIGLFRSEFLFLDSRVQPSEQQQYEAYAAAARICGGRPLTIRTLDAGGDKALPYLDTGREENPFLGWRAIRISLDRPEMFRTQLRAILRAGAEGNVRVMFPLIADPGELRAARALLDECRAELAAEGLPHDAQMRVGVMIETPAAVLLAPELAAECDFFSIGTNDLTQYVMAADRTNARVAALCNPCSAAVQRAVRMTVAAAAAAGIECGMCGELASDVSATPALLAAGLREFSVASSAVGRLKLRLAELL